MLRPEKFRPTPPDGRGRRADAIDNNMSVRRPKYVRSRAIMVAPVAYPITFVAYRCVARCLRVGLRKANASVVGCRFDHRSSCRYGLGAATCPAVELNVQLSEGPLRFRLRIGSEARPMPVDLSDEFRQMHADRHLGAHPNKYADIRQRNQAVSDGDACDPRLALNRRRKQIRNGAPPRHTPISPPLRGRATGRVHAA
jgi:hypothetical protein